MRVLLIDDEEELVTTLAERLDLRGIASDWATSGEGGLRLARQQVYDVAVLDMKMPGQGGLETLRELKRSRPGMPIIVITGHSAEEDRLASLEAGAALYLLKPMDMEDLVASMHSLVK
ncbi:MAG: response regulator [Pseudomonadota bacterium]